MNYKKSIEEIVKILKSKYHPNKIILFGSCAWGRVKKSSDIDMLIIKNTNKPYGRRWIEVGRLVRNLKKPIPLEPFVLTPEELKRQSRRNLFLQEILSKGKVLYEKG